MSVLHYPDLVPPAGWSSFRVGTQIRLIPPGTTADDARAVIIVSPLVGRQPQVPPPERLVEMAIDAEAQAIFELKSKTGPRPVTTDSGLAGIAFEVAGRPRAGGTPEKRIYVMYADATVYYGVSYMASDDAFDVHAGTFWDVARSIQPFVGRVVPPSGQVGEGY